MVGISLLECSWKALRHTRDLANFYSNSKLLKKQHFLPVNTPKTPEYNTCRRAYFMESQDAIDLARQAIMTGLLIGAPVLLVGMTAGLLIGLLQALTQIQDQTVSFVPKMVAMVLALGLCLPWIIRYFTEYSQGLITEIPNIISGG